MKRATAAKVLAASFALSACGGDNGASSGGGDDSNSVSGTILGNPFEAASSAFAVRGTPSTGGQAAYVLVSDTPNLCERRTKKQVAPNERWILMRLDQWSPPDGPFRLPEGPGLYPIDGDRSANGGRGSLEYMKFDLGCQTSVARVFGKSGQFTVESATTERIAAQGTVTIDGGETIQVAFDAPRCDAVEITIPPTSCKKAE